MRLRPRTKQFIKEKAKKHGGIKKYHLHLIFEDDSFLTATTQMWGAMELYEKGEEQHRKYVQGMKTTPIEAEFTLDYFSSLVEDVIAEKKQSVKGLLTQDQIIPGLGNAIAQDIMFRARLHRPFFSKQATVCSRLGRFA